MENFFKKLETKINEYNIFLSKGVSQNNSEEEKLKNEISKQKEELDNIENRCLEEKNKIENLKLKLLIQKIQGDIELKECELKNLENKKEEVYKKTVDKYNSSVDKKQEEIKSMLNKIKQDIWENFKSPKNTKNLLKDIILPLEVQELKDNFLDSLLNENKKLKELKEGIDSLYHTINYETENYRDAYWAWEDASDYMKRNAARNAKIRLDNNIKKYNEEIEKKELRIKNIKKNIEIIQTTIEETITKYLEKELEKINKPNFIKDSLIKFKINDL